MADNLDPTQPLTDPYGPQSLAIQRQRQLAQAMLMQSLQGAPQGQMVSGHYISPGLGAIAPILQMVLGQKLNAKVDQQQVDLGQQYQQAQADALKGYLAQRNGQQGQPEQPLPSGMAGPPAPPMDAISADPRGAATAAIISRFPSLQKIGNADLEQINKGTLTPGEVLNSSALDPKSAIAAALSAIKNGGMVDLSQAQPKQSEHVVADQIFTGTPNTGFKPAGGATYSPVQPVAETPAGPVMGQTNTGTGKVDFAPPGTNINLNTQQSANDAFASGVAKDRATQLGASRDAAVKAAQTLPALQAAQEALGAGIKSGAGGETKLMVAKWAKALGLTDDPEIANSEVYRSQIAARVATIAQEFGRGGQGVSEGDRKFAENAAGGKMTLDDKTMQHLLKVAQMGVYNTLLLHERNIQSNKGASGALPQDLAAMQVPFTIKAPDLEYDSGTMQLAMPNGAMTGQTPETPSGAPIPFEDYMRGH